jgi:outer membrane lipoprotein-sorting protein
MFAVVMHGYDESVFVPGVDPYSIYFNGATFEVYGKTDGGWEFVEESVEWHQDEVTQALETASKPLNEFFEILFNATGSRDSESAAQFYVGTEKLLGRDCAIYEISDSGVMGHGTSRIWVDIATGCWLKYESSEIGRDKEVREVTVFKLDNLEWNNTLRP